MPKLGELAWVRLDDKRVIQMPLWLIPTGIMQDGSFVKTWKEKPDAKAW